MSRQTNKAIRWVIFGVALAALAGVFLSMVAEMQPRQHVVEVDEYKVWPESAVEAAEGLPVQDGGRVKPFSTWAGFTMLRVHGARSMKVIDEGGEKVKLGATEWMLDCLFRPQLAVELPSFRVDDAAVLKAAGIEAKEKRDRYSYLELEDGRQKLNELATSYEQIPEKERDPMQRQLLALEYNVRTFEILISHFGFARGGVELVPLEEGGQAQRSDMSAVLATAPVIRERMAMAGDDSARVPGHLRLLVEQVLELASYGSAGLFVLPPEDPEDKDWRSAGQRIMQVMRGETADPSVAIADVRAMELLARSVADGEEAFAKQMKTFRERVEKRADERDEAARIDLEVSYYENNWVMRALVMFLLGLLVSLFVWITAGSKVSRYLTWGAALVLSLGVMFLFVAILVRSLIMQRPPVGNLYDTIPFITIVAVVLLLIIEAMTRRRFALGIAAVLGVLGLVLARRFEIGDAKDNMDPLVAVLDSNLWLTVHVITIVKGYSAGLLSAGLAHCYLLMRGLGLDNGDKEFRRALTRAVYGGICLTLFLSLVGTVLGGIWANYSWGRFWGWDPKENGALLIVLWCLVILHARLGGMMKEWALHLAAVFLSCVVAFSWWHVNFLGVGLHNYGFTSGKAMIWAFYLVEGLVIAFGFVAWAVEAGRRKSPKAIEPPPLAGGGQG
jgi:ABC-type transport system involved in cytochrome c biogenesis permease subunit